MENLWRYSLSLFLLAVGLVSCVELSNETYAHLTVQERQKKSGDLVSLSRFARLGSPKHMRILDKAIRLDSRNELAWKRMSNPFLYNGLYEEWNRFSDKAIKLNAKEWQGWRGYQKLFFFRDYGGALYDLDATDTLTLNKTDYAESKSVDYLRGLCYLGLKNHEKAQEFFQMYLDKEAAYEGSVQTDQTVYTYLAIIANYEQEYEKAIELLEKVDDEDIYADKYYQLALAQFMLGYIEEAEDSISKAGEHYEEGNYHRNIQFEVIHQLYGSHIEALRKDIECFL